MKEVSFIRQNIEKWKEVEKIVEQAEQTDPDRLATTYTDITSDLSFSQSHYPTSRITIYLNNLAFALHNSIYKSKKEKRSRIITFWTKEIPLVMLNSRKELFYSFLIFAISVFVGVVSTMNDDTFIRLILGDGYVDMTLNNIRNGAPMAVYSGAPEVSMFLGITLNNIGVSLYTFVMGLFTGFGSGYLLFKNGVMLGAFQAFFFQQGLLGESMLAIWIHGTLEISAIIVAGAAGLTLGNSWLFPGTYSRKVAFMKGAKRGLKIVIGTLPIFVVAGFLESFITRHTHLSDFIRLGIILLSLIFVLYYYLYLPKTLRYELPEKKD